MASLRETLDRLVSAFTEEIVETLRNVPLSEMMVLTAGRTNAHPGRRASTASRSKGTARKRYTKTELPVPPGPNVLDAAQRFFGERGHRGATEAQMHEGLKVHGVVLADNASGVIEALVERGAIRDAGFRRTTGKGTAPVYVSSLK
ncbi:MAG TPA: hypothetical protein VM925_00285 [Labilithrix sp.]|nr:hypothetical protein [Labilithrix sp.]